MLKYKNKIKGNPKINKHTNKWNEQKNVQWLSETTEQVKAPFFFFLQVLQLV